MCVGRRGVIPNFLICFDSNMASTSKMTLPSFKSVATTDVFDSRPSSLHPPTPTNESFSNRGPLAEDSPRSGSNTNTPLMLKSSIQVCVRVRPLSNGAVSAPSSESAISATGPGFIRDAGAKESISSNLPEPSKGNGGEPGVHGRLGGRRRETRLQAPVATSSPYPLPPAHNPLTGRTSKIRPISLRRPPSQPMPKRPSSSSILGPESTLDSEEKTTEKAPESSWIVESNTLRQAGENGARRVPYTLDRVFGPNSRTSDLYVDSIRPVVLSAVQGYHGSVLAYGQTGSGKTHTMTGVPSEQGVVPLAVHDVFSEVGALSQSDHRQYTIKVSYLEIYNEHVNDLLSPESTTTQDLGATANPGNSSVKIMESRSRGVFVHGAREEIVSTPSHAFSLLAVGDARRQSGATEMNQRSSRSHAVFRLLIESKQSHGTGKSTRVSSLSLVDLAGSECAKSTNSTGGRLREGQHINRSLMTLAQVVWKLAEISDKGTTSGGHIPYRDSKLTRLLQPSLGGNARVCVICTISPSLQNVDQSHDTLKFAARAKRIKQEAKIVEVIDEKTQIKKYKRQIEELKRQLAASRAKQKSIEERDLELSPALSGPIIPLSPPSHAQANTRIGDEEAQNLLAAVRDLEKVASSFKPSESTRKHFLDDDDDFDDDYSTNSYDDDLRSTVSSLTSPTQIEAYRESPSLDVREAKVASNNERRFERAVGDLRGAVETMLRKRGGVASSVTMTPSTAPESESTLHKNPSFRQDDEVLKLRAQLQRQETKTTLRQADTSFLQGQLEKKESILKDVSAILDEVEKRQQELEAENRRMKEELTMVSATIGPCCAGRCVFLSQYDATNPNSPPSVASSQKTEHKRTSSKTRERSHVKY